MSNNLFNTNNVIFSNEGSSNNRKKFDQISNEIIELRNLINDLKNQNKNIPSVLQNQLNILEEEQSILLKNINRAKYFSNSKEFTFGKTSGFQPFQSNKEFSFDNGRDFTIINNSKFNGDFTIIKKN